MSDSDSDVEIVGTSHDVNVLPADLAHLLSACNAHKLACDVKDIVTGSPSAPPVSLSACRSLREPEKKCLRSFVRSRSEHDGLMAAVAVLLQSTEYMPSVLSPRNSWLSVRAHNIYT